MSQRLMRKEMKELSREWLGIGLPISFKTFSIFTVVSSSGISPRNVTRMSLEFSRNRISGTMSVTCNKRERIVTSIPIMSIKIPPLEAGVVTIVTTM